MLGFRSANTSFLQNVNRRITLVLSALSLAALVFAVLRGQGDSPLAPAPENNPGHFVPSDVARLAATGRPQMVELFHYG